MNRKTSSTIGFERKYNTALLPRTRAAFVQMMNEHLPVRPPNLARVLQRNQEDFTRRVPAPRSRPLELAAFQQARAAGALVLDIRTPEAFCAGHIPGALHVFLHGAAFPTRVGFLVPPDKELLLIVEDEQDVALACQQLAVVGYEQIRGYLQGHMAAWQAAALPLQALAQIRATQLAEQLDLVTVLDVRDESEWQQGHIENALHIPFYELEARLSTLDTTCPYAVICAGGQRSALACSLLLRHGFGHVYNVTGGMLAWQALQLPLVSCATALDSVA
jgi:rhodanese-related sulfurtransferase